jgi:hypothetical protein
MDDDPVDALAKALFARSWLKFKADLAEIVVDGCVPVDEVDRLFQRAYAPVLRHLALRVALARSEEEREAFLAIKAGLERPFRGRVQH